MIYGVVSLKSSFSVCFPLCKYLHWFWSSLSLPFQFSTFPSCVKATLLLSDYTGWQFAGLIFGLNVLHWLAKRIKVFANCLNAIGNIHFVCHYVLSNMLMGKLSTWDFFLGEGNIFPGSKKLCDFAE